MRLRQGEYGCVLGIFPQLGRNRFKSLSLSDSENLIGVRFIVVIDGSVGYEVMKELNLIWLLLYLLNGTNMFGIG